MQQPAGDQFSPLLGAGSKECDDALALIEEVTSSAESVQQRVLCDILAQNSNTEYLRNLISPAAGCIDPQTFKNIVPLVTYEDLQPFIQRIADGDTSPILTAHPVTELFRSSGTSSGQHKLFPFIESELERWKLFALFIELVKCKHLKGVNDGKDMFFFFPRPDQRTAGDVLTRSSSASRWKSLEMRQYIKNVHTSPVEVVLGCEDVAQSTYCQLLCGLIRREEVVCLGSYFASGLVCILHVFQERWREIVEDIRSGCLSKSAVSDLTARKAVEALFRGPDPTLAMQVEAECCHEPMWKGMVSRLWPCAKYVFCATSGCMEQYIPELEFLTGDLPLISTFYGASECLFGFNLSPLCSPYEVCYTIIPNMAYFEFLPVHACDDASMNDRHHPVGLVDVKLGQEYEMVLTTFTGLNRFLVGDVLRVTGFYNKTPQFRLVGRKNVVLSVDTDKTDEQMLEQAVQAAKLGHLKAAGVWLMDYTSYTDVSTIPGHYVLFWEVSCRVGEGEQICGWEVPTEGRLPAAYVFEECCATMEQCLDIVYKNGRKQHWIGPLEIKLVRKGSFDALMDFCAARGASISQYKTPRSIKAASIIDFLNSRVSNSFFSPKKF